MRLLCPWNFKHLINVFTHICNQNWIDTKVNSINLLQWDTGSTCSMIGLKGYWKLGSPPSLPLSKTLRAYEEWPLQLKGWYTVIAQVDNEVSHNLNFIAVDEENSLNLFGLDWGEFFGLITNGSSSIDSQEENNTIFFNTTLSQRFGKKYASFFPSNLRHLPSFKYFFI